MLFELGKYSENAKKLTIFFRQIAASSLTPPRSDTEAGNTVGSKNAKESDSDDSDDEMDNDEEEDDEGKKKWIFLFLSFFFFLNFFKTFFKLFLQKKKIYL